MFEPAAIPTACCPKARSLWFPLAGVLGCWPQQGCPLPQVSGSPTTPPDLCPRWCLWGPRQEVTLSILHHTRLTSWAGKGLPLPLWGAEQETKEGMEEGVMYADLRFPTTPGNGPPTLSVGSLPSCSPLHSPEMSSQTCSLHSLSLGILSQTAPLQPYCRLPALGKERLKGRECPLHPHATAQTFHLSALPAKHCMQGDDF